MRYLNQVLLAEFIANEIYKRCDIDAALTPYNPTLIGGKTAIECPTCKQPFLLDREREKEPRKNSPVGCLDGGLR